MSFRFSVPAMPDPRAYREEEITAARQAAAAAAAAAAGPSSRQRLARPAAVDETALLPIMPRPPASGSTEAPPSAAVLSPPAPRRRHIVTPDPVSFRYLEEDPCVAVVERRATLPGYELYLVEQWVCSRQSPTIVIATYTGDPLHAVVVGVLAIPEDEREWTPRLRLYFKILHQHHARPKETPFGEILATNLSSFPSALTVIAVRDGDIRRHRQEFIVNEDLKRLGCSGRSGLTLAHPTRATQDKFQSLYKTSEKIPFAEAVLELIKQCQTALFLFGLLEPQYMDGLLCDVTERAVGDWWTEVGAEYYNAEPTDGILGPTTVAALLGLLMGARNRLAWYGASVPKDVFDVDSMKKGVGSFQKDVKLERTRRLDHQTLRRLHSVTIKAAAGEGGWGVQKAIKSTVEGFGGKRGELVFGMVGGKDKGNIGDIETLDIDKFISHIYGERPKWLWLGKPRRSLAGLSSSAAAGGGSAADHFGAVAPVDTDGGGGGGGGGSGANGGGATAAAPTSASASAGAAAPGAAGAGGSREDAATAASTPGRRALRPVASEAAISGGDDDHAGGTAAAAAVAAADTEGSSLLSPRRDDAAASSTKTLAAVYSAPPPGSAVSMVGGDTSGSPNDRDRDGRKRAVFKSVAGRVNDARSGLGRIRDAVGGGLRSHASRPSRDDAMGSGGAVFSPDTAAPSTGVPPPSSSEIMSPGIASLAQASLNSPAMVGRAFTWKNKPEEYLNAFRRERELADGMFPGTTGPGATAGGAGFSRPAKQAVAEAADPASARKTLPATASASATAAAAAAALEAELAARVPRRSTLTTGRTSRLRRDQMVPIVDTSVAGSVADDSDLEGPIREAGRCVGTSVVALLRRHSLAGVTRDDPPRTGLGPGLGLGRLPSADVWPRRLSFSAAEEAVLMWEEIVDYGDVDEEAVDDDSSEEEGEEEEGGQGERKDTEAAGSENSDDDGDDSDDDDADKDDAADEDGDAEAEAGVNKEDGDGGTYEVEGDQTKMAAAEEEDDSDDDGGDESLVKGAEGGRRKGDGVYSRALRTAAAAAAAAAATATAAAVPGVLTLERSRYEELAALREVVAPVVQERVLALEALDGVYERQVEEVQGIFFQLSAAYEHVQARSQELVAAERAQAGEALRDVETLLAKVEYEIGALASKVQDAEEGVRQFTQQVEYVEARAAELKRQMETESWLHWLVRSVTGIGTGPSIIRQ